MQKALESKRWKRGSDTLRSATDAFFKPATDVVQHVGQKAEPTLNKVSKNVGGRIIKTADRVASRVMHADGGKTVGFVRHAADATLGVAESAVEGATSMVDGTLEVTSNVVGGTIEATQSVVGGTIEATQHAVGGTIEATQSVVDGTIEATQNAAGGTFEATTSFVGGTFEATTSFVGGTLQATTDAVGGTLQATTGAVGGGLQATTNVVGGGLQATTDAMGGLFEASADAVDDTVSVTTRLVGGTVHMTHTQFDGAAVHIQRVYRGGHVRKIKELTSTGKFVKRVGDTLGSLIAGAIGGNWTVDPKPDQEDIDAPTPESRWWNPYDGWEKAAETQHFHEHDRGPPRSVMPPATKQPALYPRPEETVGELRVEVLQCDGIFGADVITAADPYALLIFEGYRL